MNISIPVDDLIEKLKAFKGKNVTRITVSDTNTDMELKRITDVQIEKVWNESNKEYKDDVHLFIRGF